MNETLKLSEVTRAIELIEENLGWVIIFNVNELTQDTDVTSLFLATYQNFYKEFWGLNRPSNLEKRSRAAHTFTSTLSEKGYISGIDRSGVVASSIEEFLTHLINQRKRRGRSVEAGAIEVVIEKIKDDEQYREIAEKKVTQEEIITLYRIVNRYMPTDSEAGIIVQDLLSSFYLD